MHVALILLAIPLLGAAPPKQIELLGTLTTQQYIYCTATGSFAARNPHLEVGFVTVRGKPALRLKSLANRVILVRGFPATVSTNSNRQPSLARCPLRQMRADWTSIYRVTRIRRRVFWPLKHLDVKTVRIVKSIRLAAKGTKQVKLLFTNPFSKPIGAHTIRAHYEGCFSKPGRTSLLIKVPALKPGAHFEATITRYRQIDSRLYRLSFLRSLIRQGQLRVDLDLGAAQFGVTITCPNWNGRRK